MVDYINNVTCYVSLAVDEHNELSSTDSDGFPSMDDTLVLNLVLEEGPSGRRLSARKGGRWTDRSVRRTCTMNSAYYI